MNTFKNCLVTGVTLGFLIFCSPLLAHKAPKIDYSIAKEQSEFNLKQANKQFDQLNLRLSVENLNVAHLNDAITVLNQLIVGANNCIDLKQKKLNSLEPLLAEATHAKDSNKSGADLVYLGQEQKKIAAQLAQCRLFSIRAQEAITTYQSTVSQLKQEQVLTRGLPLWNLLEQIHQTPTKATLSSGFTLSVPADFAMPLLLKVSILGLSILFAALVVIKTKSHQTLRKLISTKKIGIADFVLLSSCFFWSSITIYLNILLPEQLSTTSLLMLHLADIVCCYLWALALIALIFKINIVSLVFYWYSLDDDFFRKLFIFLLSYYALTIVGQFVMQSLPINELLWQLGQVVFLSGVLITAIGFFYYFCYTHQHIHFIQTHRSLLQKIITLLFIACGILNIFGYHQLALHFTYASITSFAILFSMILLERALQNLYALCTHSSKLHRGIIQMFGYKPDQPLVEFIILKTTLQIIVLFTAIYLISQTWGYGSYYIDNLYSQLLNGVHFASFTFYPTRIISGIIIFCVLYLFFRSISTKLSQHAQFEDEEETQVAVASILTYIGFAVALIAALFVSGIDFTGLAIVAGALSVGIGLGLQSIVNNFVSGIILLIEKPIKPGDRISIDGVEGVVKKIRVRSTQITTSAREDVIIPNSDLITHPVTNFMFADKALSICCDVGVAYNSDPLLVKTLLLQAVHAHDDVIKTNRSKPSVLFHAFGESAMIFQVWFLIKDGNKKSHVRSDINFSIEQLFREHQIKIAYPQRDINIKLSDTLTKISDK
ncbi:MAG: portal protein [Legionella sp.]|nr:MAG: portal protein [Legionella sp.]